MRIFYRLCREKRPVPTTFLGVVLLMGVCFIDDCIDTLFVLDNFTRLFALLGTETEFDYNNWFGLPIYDCVFTII